jgi:signal transduction histidine kinase
MSAGALLTTQYTAALEEYLDGAGESALSRAYDLGRKALGSGLGVLEMSAIHHEAIKAVAVWAGDPEKRRLEKAADFFAESLSPFEMAFRGYEDVNHKLLALNETLARQNVELGQAKSAADAANGELEAFSYSVAHDLRAPLRSIDGFSTALLEEWSDRLDPQGKDYLTRVAAGAKRMQQLIDDLLELARLTRNALHKSRVDLGGLAQQVFADLRRSDPQRQVEFVVAEPLMADADPRLIRVVLENLLGNAWKFTGKQPQARIEVGSETQGTYFIRDNGAGFEMKWAGKLFAPFQRLHKATDFPGTGIGLATVQRIIGYHGGKVWPESEPGKGATFFFTLPAGIPGGGS